MNDPPQEKSCIKKVDSHLIGGILKQNSCSLKENSPIDLQGKCLNSHDKNINLLELCPPNGLSLNKKSKAKY